MSDKLSALRNLISSLETLRVIDFLKSPPDRQADVANEIGQLCHTFSFANAAKRAEIASLVRPTFSFVFFWFARMTAEKAIRESSQAAIRDGLIALVIENCAFDARDTILRLALLYHSATKLKMDVETLFAETADLGVDPNTAKIVREFPQRPPDARDLAAFRYEEFGSGSSFAYRRVGGEDMPF